MFDDARARLARIDAAAHAGILLPDERLLAHGLVASPFAGRDDIETGPSQAAAIVERALAAVDDLPPLPKGFLAVSGAAAILSDPFAGWTPDVNRLLGGRIGHGAADSVAALFRDALRENGDLTVTDRRLGLTVETDDKIDVPEAAIPVAARDWKVVVPRDVVHGVRRRRRPFEWGRIELCFTDGSSVILTAGMISGRRADRLVAALTTPA